MGNDQEPSATEYRDHRYRPVIPAPPRACFTDTTFASDMSHEHDQQGATTRISVCVRGPSLSHHCSHKSVYGICGSHGRAPWPASRRPLASPTRTARVTAHTTQVTNSRSPSRVPLIFDHIALSSIGASVARPHTWPLISSRRTISGGATHTCEDRQRPCQAACRDYRRL